MNRFRQAWIRACGAVAVALVPVLLTSGCAQLQSTPHPDYFWTVHSRSRSDADRVMDQNLRPEKLLEFWNVGTGMRVADLNGGDGYFAELLARIVGPQGRVYAQIPPRGSRGTGARFAARAKKPVMANVVRIVRDFEAPLPPEAQNLDLVTSSFTYHALIAAAVDRGRTNRAVFDALKPGGVYAIADYAGRPGAGATEARILGRTDPALLRREVEAAGFRLNDEAGFLRNSADPHDVPVAALAGRADAVVLRFVKP